MRVVARDSLEHLIRSNESDVPDEERDIACIVRVSKRAEMHFMASMYSAVGAQTRRLERLRTWILGGEDTRNPFAASFSQSSGTPCVRDTARAASRISRVGANTASTSFVLSRA